MNWNPEPPEIDRPQRASVRGKRYTMVPPTHASISALGMMFPVNLQTSLSVLWSRPITAVTAVWIGSMRGPNGNMPSAWWWIHWQSAGIEWHRCAL